MPIIKEDRGVTVVLGENDVRIGYGLADDTDGQVVILPLWAETEDVTEQDLKIENAPVLFAFKTQKSIRQLIDHLESAERLLIDEFNTEERKIQ